MINAELARRAGSEAAGGDRRLPILAKAVLIPSGKTPAPRSRYALPRRLSSPGGIDVLHATLSIKPNTTVGSLRAGPPGRACPSFQQDSRLCLARIKSAFTMNNIQRADVTLLHGLWMTKLHLAKHKRRIALSVATLRTSQPEFRRCAPQPLLAFSSSTRGGLKQ
jgi:hypothetical protein